MSNALIRQLLDLHTRGELDAWGKKLLHSLLYGGVPPTASPYTAHYLTDEDPAVRCGNPSTDTYTMDTNPPRELPKQELLLKMLQMTSSDNDNQALVAIRKANDLLKAAGWDWEKLIRGKITVVADPFASTPIPQPGHAGVTPPAPPSRPTPPRTSTVRFTQAHPIHAPPKPKPPPPPPPPPPPKGMVNSYIPNRFPGDCWCCGDFMDSQKGFLFKPLDFNSAVKTATRKPICTPCNNNPKLWVPATPVKGKSARLEDIL